MSSRDPSHIYRKGMWDNYNASKHPASHGAKGAITPPGQRDPEHLYRKGFWDAYGVQTKGAGSGGRGSGSGRGRGKARKKQVHHVRWSRHMIASAALHDAWGHRYQAGGQG